MMVSAAREIPEIAVHGMAASFNQHPPAPPVYAAPFDWSGDDSPVPPPEHLDGQPAYLCVRHTFVDICSSLPQPQLLRASTAPDASTASTVCSTDDEHCASPAHVSFLPCEAEQRVLSPVATDAFSGLQADDDDFPPPPPALALESFSTPEWYENPYSSTFDPLPSLPESTANSWLPATSGVLSAAVSEDRSPACLSVKRTFLDFSCPPEPDLTRARTAPETCASDSDAESDDEATLPPPPPLSLDKLMTPDCYEFPPAPAPLGLEKMITPDCYGIYGAAPPLALDMLVSPKHGEIFNSLSVAETLCSLPPDSRDSPSYNPLPGVPEGIAALHVPTVQSLPPATWSCPERPVAVPVSPYGWSPALPPPRIPGLHGYAAMLHLGAAAAPPPPLYQAPLGVDSEPAMPPPDCEAEIEDRSTQTAPNVPGIVTEKLSSGKTRTFWALDARKLDSQDKQAVSPVFEIEMPGEQEPLPFRLVIKPTPKNDGRRGAGFKKSKGKGRIELKCEAPRDCGSQDIVFRFAIGRGEGRQPTRGPVAFNFAEHGSTSGLPKGVDEWDFGTAVDECKTFLVILEVMPKGRTL